MCRSVLTDSVHVSLSAKMEEFKSIHGELYKLQNFCGFWPVPETRYILINRIKRVVINAITIACLVIQYSTLRNIELTLDTVLSTVSFSFPMILFFVRYMAYISAHETMGKIFKGIENDFVKWKNTAEMELLKEEIEKAKLIYYYYLRLVTFTVVALYVAFIPIITQTKHQVAYLRYFGFYFTEQSFKTTLVCFHIMFVYGVGIFCILGTEISLSVISHHICGLLKITCYKITKAVNESSRSPVPLKVDVAPAQKLHLKAMSVVEDVSQDLGLSYLVTIVTAIVSFSLNLWRLYMVITQRNFDEAMAPFLIILSHVIILYLGNHCGQRVSSTSGEIFNTAYFTEWYNITVHEKKLVMFIMMKSSKELVFSLLSLYTANYEGYSTILRTAFSYFTVLLSVQ